MPNVRSTGAAAPFRLILFGGRRPGQLDVRWPSEDLAHRECVTEPYPYERAFAGDAWSRLPSPALSNLAGCSRRCHPGELLVGSEHN